MAQILVQCIRMADKGYHRNFRRLVHYLFRRNIRNFDIKNWPEYFGFVENCTNPRWTKAQKKYRRCIATKYYREHQDRIDRAVQRLGRNWEDEEFEENSDGDSEAESRASDDSNRVS